ncbi:MAG: aldo/keto reductase [Bacilli bacterium]|nr:aldo/keto reductase [Bacilli bacterium]
MEKSRIIQGLMRLKDVDENQLYELVKFDLEHGIYFFDLADIYCGGDSERKIGQVLKAHPELRKQMFIQTKGSIRWDPEAGTYYDLSYEHIMEAVDASLERLGTDYIDSFLLHRPDIFIDADEVAKAMDELYKSGKVKHFGVSNFPKEIIEYLSKRVHQKIEFNQIQLGAGHTPIIEEVLNFNVKNNEGVVRTGGTLFYMKEHDIQIQAWSPYNVGYFEGSLFDESHYPEVNKVLDRLAAKYRTSKCAVATAFILKLTKDIHVVTGSINPIHIQESLDGEKIELSKADWYAIYKEGGHFLP